ncbi:MAG: YidC/Oxa1 family insertase periplasmic-domain containing protein [Candidatus Omnitrophica bacterium]|nr:YidC/Oxa1 family insertase periplasmic-domain containing protein [Candidatus Omnitrophota bacterium]
MANPLDNLSHEKRIAIAGILCLLTAVTFSKVFAPEPPPKPSEARLIGEDHSASMHSGDEEEEIVADTVAPATPSIDQATSSEVIPPRAPVKEGGETTHALAQPEPLPEKTNVTVDTPTARYVFSTEGAALYSCRLKNYEEIDPPLRLFEAQKEQARTIEAKTFWEERIEEVRARKANIKDGEFIPRGEPVPEDRWVELIPQLDSNIGHPLGLRFGEGLDDRGIHYTVNHDNLMVGEGQSATLEFVAKTETGITLKKRLVFSSDKPAFEIDVDIRAQGGVEELEKTLGHHWILEWPDGICHLPFHYPGSQEENKLRAMLSDSMQSLTQKKSLMDEAVDKSQGKSYRKTLEGRVGWINIETRYFLASFVPQSPNMQGVYILPHVNQAYPFTEIDTRMGIGLISTFSETPKSILVYAGPKLTGVLENVAIGLDRVVYDSWFETLDKICRFVDWLLAFFYSVIPSYGIAIILLCILSKIILYPLTYKQAQMQKKMAVLQPKIQELKEKYADDAQKLQQEQMKLWKKHGVSPAGCLPMFAQLPIFIALYRTIMASIEMRGAPFLWIHDLSLPDMTFFLPFALPFLGNAVNVLPFIMTGISAAQMHQQKKNMPDPNQAQIMMFMTVFFFFILYNFSSGLVLYWMTNSITMIFQQKLMEHYGHAHIPAHRAGTANGSALDEDEEDASTKKGPDVPLPQKSKGKRSKKRNR